MNIINSTPSSPGLNAPGDIRHHLDGFGVFPARISSKEGSINGLYTIGMNRISGHPDVMILGVEDEFALQIIHILHIGVMTGEYEIPGDGEMLADVLNEPVLVKHLEADLLAALPLLHHELYSGQAVKMVQLIVPDPDGRYPSDPLCRPEFVRQQNVEFLLK